MLNYLQGTTRIEKSITVHQCARFCNYPRLVHECAAKKIANYLERTSVNVDLLDKNLHLTTIGVVYKPDI